MNNVAKFKNLLDEGLKEKTTWGRTQIRGLVNSIYTRLLEESQGIEVKDTTAPKSED